MHGVILVHVYWHLFDAYSDASVTFFTPEAPNYIRLSRLIISARRSLPHYESPPSMEPGMRGAFIRLLGAADNGGSPVIGPRETLRPLKFTNFIDLPTLINNRRHWFFQTSFRMCSLGCQEGNPIQSTAVELVPPLSFQASSKAAEVS